MNPSDPRWKAAADPGPDPLTYKALLGEFKLGYKSGENEVENTDVAPESAAMNLEAGDVIAGAEEVIDLMKRVVTTAKSGAVGVQAERFVAKLSSGLSKVVYNLGKVHGYRDAGRLRYWN